MLTQLGRRIWSWWIKELECDFCKQKHRGYAIWIRFKAHQIPSAKVNSTWNISVIGIPWTTLAEYSFTTQKKKSCPANRTTLRPKLQYYSWEMMGAISCPANSSWHFIPQQKEFAGDFVANKLNRVLHVFCYHFLLSFFCSGK